MSATIKLPEDQRARERVSRALIAIFDHPEWAEVEALLIAPNIEKERGILGTQFDEKQLFRAQGRMAIWDGINDLTKQARAAVREGKRTI